jgi:Ras-related GTP-binding protein A/B
VYVDIDNSGDNAYDISLLKGILNVTERCSPDASIFVLIHKMDLVAEEDKDRIFSEKSNLIKSISDQ